MPSGKWLPFCLGLVMLMGSSNKALVAICLCMFHMKHSIRCHGGNCFRIHTNVVICFGYGPTVRYVKLQVAHAPGMPGTFSPSPRVSDPDMHHGTCVTHVPWCMPGSLTSSFLWSRWSEKRSRHSRHMRKPQFYVSAKRPIEYSKSYIHQCPVPITNHKLFQFDTYAWYILFPGRLSSILLYPPIEFQCNIHIMECAASRISVIPHT